MANSVGRRALILLFSGLIIIANNCGHKAAPLARDRQAPSLKKVASLNNRQVLFSFSEGIDTNSLKPENFTIRADSQPLKVITLYPALSSAEIVAITDPQAEVVYDVSGSVHDSSENKGNFRGKFTGLTRPDTLAPVVQSSTAGPNKRIWAVQFNEAMDESSLSFAILPKKSFVPVWQDFRTLSFVPRDSTEALRYDTTYYFLIRQARDFSGNPLAPFTVRITPDTIYKPYYLRGKVKLNDSLVATGWAVLSRDRPVGVAPIDKGEFVFEVRDSLAFFVDAVWNNCHGRAEVRTGHENVVNIKPEEFNIDSLIN